MEKQPLNHKSLIQPLPPGPLDIVGDVHGEWDALQNLLQHLGYDAQGQHPQGRTLVFVGDLCDRGPDTPAVFDWLLPLIEQKKAFAVLGNHEINLIREDEKDGSGWFFPGRLQSDQPKYAPFVQANNAQRKYYLQAVAQWPVALEREDLRIVHAAWHPPAIAQARSFELGAARLRYGRRVPGGVDDAQIPKLVNHLHLPVQHGSDRILMAMKRGYTAMEYKSTVRKLRAIRPDLAMSSDFIVGFPGETDEDFAKLMKLIDDIGFDNSFSFIYSPRPGTPAANLHDDTPHEVKLRRLQTVQAAINANIKRISEERVGTVQRLLVEGPSKRDASELMGRTECNRVVNFPAPPAAQRLIGQMADVRITEAMTYTLRGEVLVREEV